jgi:hypothetical protein
MIGLKNTSHKASEIKKPEPNKKKASIKDRARTKKPKEKKVI